MSSVIATVSHVLASDLALFVRATRIHAYMLHIFVGRGQHRATPTRSHSDITMLLPPACVERGLIRATRINAYKPNIVPPE